MTKLSQSTVEKLGYYVYLLSDPRSKKVFYVGKGCGNRINHHLLGALEKTSKETEKIKIIRAIQKAGEEVDLIILRHGLTEKEALEVECAAIDLIGINNLTNLIQGHHSIARGKMTLNDIKIEYEAEEAVFEEPVILININKRYFPEMSEKEIYEVTRGHWKVGQRAKKIALGCAVYRGVIREVFEIDSWYPSTQGGRSCFKGRLAPEAIRKKYLFKSVSQYWKQGSQNPIKYVDGLS